jgi:hypothetical protein
MFRLEEGGEEKGSGRKKREKGDWWKVENGESGFEPAGSDDESTVPSRRTRRNYGNADFVFIFFPNDEYCPSFKIRRSEK